MEATEALETQRMQRVFEALSSSPRRKILAYLSASSLTAGEIAARFNMSKPSVSQHLGILDGLARLCCQPVNSLGHGAPPSQCLGRHALSRPEMVIQFLFLDLEFRVDCVLVRIAA